MQVRYQAALHPEINRISPERQLKKFPSWSALFIACRGENHHRRVANLIILGLQKGNIPLKSSYLLCVLNAFRHIYFILYV
jgi:hypothetical protein